MTSKELFEPFIDVSAIKDADKFLIQAVNESNSSTETSTAVRLTAALLKAYLTRGLVDVNEDGYLVVNGVVTESNINTPQFRRGATGVEVSTDNGNTWNTIIQYSEIAFRQPVVNQTEESVTIFPNVLNVWGKMSNINIKLGAASSEEVSEYMIQFSCGESPTTLTLPSTVKWMDEPEFEANATYQISILNGLAVYVGWSNE